MPDEMPSSGIGSVAAVAGHSDAQAAAEKAERVARARRRLADRESQLARHQSSVASDRLAVERARQDLTLAERGMKRSFWTGRIINVKPSRRARAHVRRNPRRLR